MEFGLQEMHFRYSLELVVEIGFVQLTGGESVNRHFENLAWSPAIAVGCSLVSFKLLQFR